MRRSPSAWLPVLVAIALALCAGQPAARQTGPARTAFIAGRLGDEELITLSAAIGARSPEAVLLLDTPKATTANQLFLAAFRPEKVVPVGSFPEGVPDLERRLGVSVAHAVPWQRGPPEALWEAIFPQTVQQVVVCTARPRRMLLQAACLAGTLQAPLLVAHDANEADVLRRWLARWKAREVVLIGGAAHLAPHLSDVRTTMLASEAAVASAHRERLRTQGPVETLVVANAADIGEGLRSMSTLAPWVALQRRAALLLTNDTGTDATSLVKAALAEKDLSRAEYLFLVAHLKAIPMERRPNPAPGKDTEIEMEPMTPLGSAPFSLAVGRLFHEDPGIAALLLARRQLIPVELGPRRALVVSNPGGGLQLLETISRNTALELRNCGYQTTSVFGEKVAPDELRRLLPEQDVFLWEGHYKTLIEEYGFPLWKEPLRPSLIFLQSCLALNEAETATLFRRGAYGVVGSSSRIYSATGGAFSLAFFDALLYDSASVGSALRQAKNFLVCYALLKEKRLGDESKLSGANYRSAWAFTLWGDPTMRLPRAVPAPDALPAVRCRVEGRSIYLDMPDQRLDRIKGEKYQARMLPNGRLAGLIRKEDEEKDLVPLLFSEVRLPRAPSGQVPKLSSRLPSSRYVFNWDERRRCGYLLVLPRASDEGELRFRIDWQAIP